MRIINQSESVIFWRCGYFELIKTCVHVYSFKDHKSARKIGGMQNLIINSLRAIMEYGVFLPA